jgi:localization factor PodJL
MLPATAYDAEHPPVHNPDAEALLKRFLSEVSGYRQVGNAAFQELEARLTAMSNRSSNSQYDEATAEQTPTPPRSAPDMRYAPAAESEERSLEERLRELTGHLHADLSRYEAMNERNQYHGSEDANASGYYSQRIYAGSPSYGQASRNTPTSPVLDRMWFEERFAAMRVSVAELAEKIPTRRMDALENQFQRLMERLDARENINGGIEAVESGLKRLAAYLEDSKQLAGQHDERVRNVEERIEQLSGLVAQSHAAISATTKGIECIVRNTGPRLAQQTAELVAIQIQERLAQLQAHQPLEDLNREVINLSVQSRQNARDTDERLKELQAFLSDRLMSSEAIGRRDLFSSDSVEERPFSSDAKAGLASSSSSPLSSAAAGQAALREAHRTPETAPKKVAHPDDETDNEEHVTESIENYLVSNAFEEGDDYDRELIAAAQRAARLAEGPKRDVLTHGEPIKYQIPYREFLPDEDQRHSHLGLVVAVAILLLASAAMLFLNLRGKDGPGIQSSAPDTTTVQRKKFATQQLPSVSPQVNPPSGVLVAGEAQPPARDPAPGPGPEKTETGAATSTETITPVVVQKAPAPISSAAPQLPGTTKESVREAAVKGEPNAQFSVGQSYLSGHDSAHQLGENERLSMAARWFRRAAEGGHAASQYRLGTLYEMGQGAPKDLAEAEHWYRQAAEAGHVKAMHNIAVLAVSGHTGITNYISAAKWFAKAAEYGLADSQYNLAVLYERGLGVSADRNKAYEWYALAAKQGDAKAAQKRDVLAGMLTPADKVAADAVVAAWKRRVADPQVNGAAPEPPTGEQSDKAADNPPAGSTLAGQTSEPEVPQVQVMKATAEANEVKPDAMVLEAQRYLSRLGYYSGPKDGVPGPRTASAVRRFELQDGFVPTGRITEALLVRLAYLQE